uniref:Uncharacterized protein n=1 Tax=Anopheles atroparvus TaxID=41427 RepID=A0A182IYW8_ANOAO
MEFIVAEKNQHQRRLQAQRNELNAKPMDKKKVLVKVHPEGKIMVVIDKNIGINDVTPNCHVALRNESYTLHKILPNKVDPLVSLMMVEKVPDSIFEMVGGLDEQFKEIKEVIELPVKHPELFDALGIAQLKGVLPYGPPGTGNTLLAGAVAHHKECTFMRVSGSKLVQKFIDEGSLVSRKARIHPTTSQLVQVPGSQQTTRGCATSPVPEAQTAQEHTHPAKPSKTRCGPAFSSLRYSFCAHRRQISSPGRGSINQRIRYKFSTTGADSSMQDVLQVQYQRRSQRRSIPIPGSTRSHPKPVVDRLL